MLEPRSVVLCWVRMCDSLLGTFSPVFCSVNSQYCFAFSLPVITDIVCRDCIIGLLFVAVGANVCSQGSCYMLAGRFEFEGVSEKLESRFTSSRDVSMNSCSCWQDIFGLR